MRCALKSSKYSKSAVDLAAVAEQPSDIGTTRVERRRRKRAKLSSPVRVRVLDSHAAFQEVCKTVDVSRDGILFLSPHSGYQVGQHLEVTFPYSAAPSALNHPQPADVVRAFESGAGLFGVAVQFVPATASRKSAVASENTPAPQSAHTTPSAVVLLVESDRRVSDRLRELIKRDGYTMVVVPSAKAALNVLDTTVPAVLVAPENGDMDGQDLCATIRKDDRLQHVPVILLTSPSQPNSVPAQQLGAVVSLAKSSSPDRLLQMIRLLAPPPTKASAYGAPQHRDLDRSL